MKRSLFAFMVALLFSCSSEQAGNATETTNGISGVAKDSLQNPLADATILLNKKVQNQWLFFDSTTTDAKGQFHFSTPIEGVYSVIAQSNQLLAQYPSFNYAKNSTYELPTHLVLKKPETLRVLLAEDLQLDQDLFLLLEGSTEPFPLPNKDGGLFKKIPFGSLRFALAFVGPKGYSLYTPFQEFDHQSASDTLHFLNTYHWEEQFTDPLFDDFEAEGFFNLKGSVWWTLSKNPEETEFIKYWDENWSEKGKGGFSYTVKEGNQYLGIGSFCYTDRVSHFCHFSQLKSITFDLHYQSNLELHFCFASTPYLDRTPLCTQINPSNTLENYTIDMENILWSKTPKGVDPTTFLMSANHFHLTFFGEGPDEGFLILDQFKFNF